MNSKQDPQEPVTVGMLNEAVDAILEGIEKMVGGVRGEMTQYFTSTFKTWRTLLDTQIFISIGSQSLYLRNAFLNISIKFLHEI
jgi:hypothetical protein